MITLPNVVYAAGDFTIAQPCSLPVFSAPIDGVNVFYLLTQEWEMDANSFAPEALNTPHPDFADYVLTGEGPQSDLGNGVVRWTRTYAKVPDTYTESGGSLSYNFIGFQGYTQTSSTDDTPLTGRPRFTRTVPVQITREFFLTGSGQTYVTSEQIPVIDQQQYLLDSTQYYVDFLSDDPPYANQTDPGRAEYDALITTDAATVNSFSLVAEASRITRWQGNIFMRETLRIKAI